MSNDAPVRYKLHCGWLYECATYFKPAAIQDDVPLVMASDYDALKAEVERLKADAERFRFIADCPIRTAVVLSRKSFEDGFDLRTECDLVMSCVDEAMQEQQP